MAPTYRDGDMLVVDGLSVGVPGPERHDVVIITNPHTGQLLVKRVAAVAGDQVGIADGVLVVNGNPVPERYVDQNLMDSVYFGPVTVPQGAVFVLGDNRSNSIDSRDFGPVPVADVRGRVLAKVSPLW
jgi:signal peptidase I